MRSNRLRIAVEVRIGWPRGITSAYEYHNQALAGPVGITIRPACWHLPGRAKEMAAGAAMRGGRGVDRVKASVLSAMRGKGRGC